MTPEGGEARVELKRFLCGVPFSHVRDITPEERKELIRELVPHGGLAVVSLLAMIVFVAQAIRAGGGFHPVVWSLTGGILTAVLVFCHSRARDHLATLRSGKVSVYIGRMNDLEVFDRATEHFQANHEAGEHFDRYVEILAIGGGDRLWRLEGISDLGALRKVRPIDLALIPDRDERGARPLSEEEREELRLRAADFHGFGVFVAKNLFAWYLMLQAVKFLQLFIPTVIWPVATLAFLGIAFAIWVPYVKRRRFARMLREDAEAGIVRDGALASGLPWVVDGEPARWRLGRAAGSGSAVSKEQAILLQQNRDSEEADEDEEFVRQALAGGNSP
ncbi:MAG: hypothetical protein ACO1SV_20225 [Fimbriimonas sp.]